MDTVQWPQEIVVKPIDEIVTNTCPKPPLPPSASLERKARPQKEQALNCPRCNSTNTKFCYYNNYSLTQPRYFCKACRRYWTEGGSLRNIPVGGGSRKNKRSSSSSSSVSASSSASSSKKLPDLVTAPQASSSPANHHQNPKIHEGQDLNLAFPSTQGIRSFSELIQLPSINEQNKHHHHPISSSSPSAAAVSTSSTSQQLSALELLAGISSRGGLNSNSFPMPVQDPNALYTSNTFPFHDFKPTLSFTLDGLGSGYGSLHGVQETNGRQLLFPFEDLKQVSSTTDIDHHHHHQQQNKDHHGTADSSGYWTGMLGGAGSW